MTISEVDTLIRESQRTVRGSIKAQIKALNCAKAAPTPANIMLIVELAQKSIAPMTVCAHGLHTLNLLRATIAQQRRTFDA